MAELRKASDSPFTLEDAEAHLQHDKEELRHRSRRFQLAVGVINGAGFTAVGAKVLEALAGPSAEGAGVVALIFPSAMLFLLGLLAIGASIGLDVISSHLMVNRGQALRARILSGRKPTMKVTALSFWDVVRLYSLEATSGVLFVAGVAYPLAVLTLRYFQDGGFTW